MKALSSSQLTSSSPIAKARSVVKVACVARPSHNQPSSKTISSQSLQLNASLLPLIPVIAAARVNPIESFLKPQAEYFSTLGLPEWLIHWGHPGNMAVVLFAMGFYGRLVIIRMITLSPLSVYVTKLTHPLSFSSTVATWAGRSRTARTSRLNNTLLKTIPRLLLA